MEKEADLNQQEIETDEPKESPRRAELDLKAASYIDQKYEENEKILS